MGKADSSIRAQVARASWGGFLWKPRPDGEECPIEGANREDDGLWWIDLVTAEDVFDLMPCVIESVGENDPYRVLIYDGWIE